MKDSPNGWIDDAEWLKTLPLGNQTQICKGADSGHGNGAAVPFGCFRTLGDLWLDNGKQSSYENYCRELDLEDAVVRIKYTQDGVNYKC